MMFLERTLRQLQTKYNKRQFFFFCVSYAFVWNATEQTYFSATAAAASADEDDVSYHMVANFLTVI